MSKDSFQPQTAFEGYVKANLEGLKDRLDNIPCQECFRRLNKCENDISNMKGKATMLGIIAGSVAGFFTKWIIGK